MIVRIVTCRVKPGSEAEFETATTMNCKGSIGEAGVMRFDLLKDSDAPGTYYIYEVYRDHDATLSHKETDHYKKWRDAVAVLMAADRTSVVCSVIEPTSVDKW